METIICGITNINIFQNSMEDNTESQIKPSFLTTDNADNATTPNDSPNWWLNDKSKVSDADANKFAINHKVDMEQHALHERRQLPPRASKCNSSLSIKQRSIMKPNKRNQQKLKDFTNMKTQDIIKIYTKANLKNFKSSCLETIIEEPSTISQQLEHDDLSTDLCFISGRKLKRCIMFSNAIKPQKSVVNKRRAKIKKSFGRRLALTKISLEEFLEKFNSISDEEDKVEEKQLQQANAIAISTNNNETINVELFSSEAQALFDI